MKPIISPLVHGYIDYAAVAGFLLAPAILGLSGMDGMLAYLLALIHLAMTLATDFPLGRFKMIPFSVHALIERIVGPLLLLAPFVLSFGGAAKVFYFVMGAAIIVVGLLTEYKTAE